MTRSSIAVFCVALAATSLVTSAHADDIFSRNSLSKDGKNISASGSPDSAKHASSAATPGSSLYSTFCFGCHGVAKKGTMPALIRHAIDNNTGGMGFMKTLSPEQLEAISRGR